MPVPKSPFGKLQQINLRYREEDPSLPGLGGMLLRVPEGRRNKILVQCLYEGLEAYLDKSGAVSSNDDLLSPKATSGPQGSALTNDPAPAEKSYSSAAEKMFRQWDQ